MTIPKEIKAVISKLQKAGFQAYIVGGCVRDFLLETEPKDWDVATNAKPEEIQKVFPNNFYENRFLTVTVKTGPVRNSPPQRPSGRASAGGVSNGAGSGINEVEVTTYRLEAKYSDKRHPDEIRFAKTLDEDLERRDFTVNAMAISVLNDRNVLDVVNGKNQAERLNKRARASDRTVKTYTTEVVDLFDGQKDLKNKIIRTVGNPEERFNEDALRMLRAVRLASTLGFSAKGGPALGWKIEPKTAEAIKKNSTWLETISKERIRDEFLKIVMSDNASDGIELLRELELLKFILPELLENYGVGQNKHHIYDCYTHALKALAYTAKKKFNVHVRLAALFHDIAKPRVKAGEGKDSTFYNHEVVGAKMTFEILNRLKFSKKDVEKITKLVRYHLFYYNVDEVSESSVRRLVKNVGTENIEELLQVRQADRIGSGVPKAEPYKLRHLKYVIDKVSQDPISAKMLKANGKDVMDILNIQPGPKVGQILSVLLGYVLEDPKKNSKEFLEKEIKKLGKLSEKELEKLSVKSKEERMKMETKKDEMTKQKYWVT
ncbi:MAG: HD domain-containing protein [Patescibacteria group bacterium]